MTLTSLSGDYDCTFSGAAVDSNGFTTFGRPGFYVCRRDFRSTGFRCPDGSHLDLSTLGQDVSGTISGDDINGKWQVSWVDADRSDVGLTTTMEFTWTRKQ